MKIKLKTFASLNRTKVNKTYFLKNPKCQNAKKRFVLCENQYERRKTHITHKQMIEIHLYFHIFHIEILQDGIIFRYALRNASFLFYFFYLFFFHFAITQTLSAYKTLFFIVSISKLKDIRYCQVFFLFI